MSPRGCARMVVVAALVGSGLLNTTCSRGGSAASTPPPSPDPTNTIPNLGGSWSGTIESPSFQTRNITMLLTQTGVDCVDGAWQTAPAEWSGAVSGFARSTTFAGVLSLAGPPDGSGLCASTNTVSGSNSDTSIKWAVTYDGACAGGIAQTVTFRLHR